MVATNIHHAHEYRNYDYPPPPAARPDPSKSPGHKGSFQGQSHKNGVEGGQENSREEMGTLCLGNFQVPPEVVPVWHLVGSGCLVDH